MVTKSSKVQIDRYTTYCKTIRHYINRKLIIILTNGNEMTQLETILSHTLYALRRYRYFVS